MKLYLVEWTNPHNDRSRDVWNAFLVQAKNVRTVRRLVEERMEAIRGGQTWDEFNVRIIGDARGVIAQIMMEDFLSA